MPMSAGLVRSSEVEVSAVRTHPESARQTVAACPLRDETCQASQYRPVLASAQGRSSGFLLPGVCSGAAHVACSSSAVQEAAAGYPGHHDRPARRGRPAVVGLEMAVTSRSARRRRPRVAVCSSTPSSAVEASHQMG